MDSRLPIPHLGVNVAREEGKAEVCNLGFSNINRQGKRRKAKKMEKYKIKYEN